MIRFSARYPCPVCCGFDRMPRGEGIRCSGFIGDNPSWCRCSRPEHAGELPIDQRTDPPTYAHKLDGPCRCGTEHGVALPSLHPVSTSPPSIARRIVETYPYQDADGRVVYRAVRFEPKSFAPQHPTETGGWE